MKLPPRLSALRNDLLPVHHAVVGDSVFRRAAVLILLYPRNDTVTFALTVRPETLTRHPGQVSLPGGMFETEDASLWHAAVRETREELGMAPGRVVPLGRLNDVTARVSANIITPFVGWNPVTPRFRPDRNEVSRVLEIPLMHLLDPDSIEEETWELRGSNWKVAFYRLSDTAVWGITGRILSDFHQRLEDGDRTVRPGSVRRLV